MTRTIFTDAEKAILSEQLMLYQQASKGRRTIILKETLEKFRELSPEEGSKWKDEVAMTMVRMLYIWPCHLTLINSIAHNQSIQYWFTNNKRSQKERHNKKLEKIYFGKKSARKVFEEMDKDQIIACMSEKTTAKPGGGEWLATYRPAAKECFDRLSESEKNNYAAKAQDWNTTAAPADMQKA
jgi:hypothetical protein